MSYPAATHFSISIAATVTPWKHDILLSQTSGRPLFRTEQRPQVLTLAPQPAVPWAPNTAPSAAPSTDPMP